MTDLHEAYLAMVNEKNLFPASVPPCDAGNLAGVEQDFAPPATFPDWMQKPGETFGNVRERFRRDLAQILDGKKL